MKYNIHISTITQEDDFYIAFFSVFSCHQEEVEINPITHEMELDWVNDEMTLQTSIIIRVLPTSNDELIEYIKTVLVKGYGYKYEDFI
jgi:hypothetical protein